MRAHVRGAGIVRKALAEIDRAVDPRASRDMVSNTVVGRAAKTGFMRRGRGAGRVGRQAGLDMAGLDSMARTAGSDGITWRRASRNVRTAQTRSRAATTG